MIKKCIGCGVELQSNDSNKPGYIPKNTVNENRYCMRCFKIMHYNMNIKEQTLINEDDIINTVNNKAKYVFFLIDYLNINNETISKFQQIKKPKTLLISKSDIIPKNIKEEKLKIWLKNIYEINSDIEFISSTKKTNINKIFNIMKNNNIKESYILGYTNAGKSSLINAIANKYEITNKKITTSLNPNTTLDYIEFDFNEFKLIDTPGFNPKHNFTNNNIELIKKANSKKCIRPITYQTHKDISFNVEDKILINIITKENSITFYISNNINIIKKFDLLTNNKNKINFVVKSNQEIVIAGLGFINIKEECEVEIYTDDKQIIEIRNSSF